MNIPSSESRHTEPDGDSVEALLSEAAAELGYGSGPGAIELLAESDPAMFNRLYRQALGLPVEDYESLTEE